MSILYAFVGFAIFGGFLFFLKKTFPAKGWIIYLVSYLIVTIISVFLLMEPISKKFGANGNFVFLFLVVIGTIGKLFFYRKRYLKSNSNG